MPKKIVILGPAYPLRGGLATFDEELAYHLLSDGREVQIWSYSLQYPSVLFPGKSQYEHDRSVPDGVEIRPVINSVNPLNWIQVGRMLKKLQPDIIFTRYWMSFFGPSLGTILRQAKNKNSEIVTLVDNINPHESRIIDKPFNRYFLPASDRFVTMSEDVAKDLRKVTNKPITVTPHPLYEGFGEAVSQNEACSAIDIPDSDVRTFLFFGFIRKYKGLDMLLDALSVLKEDGRKFRLIIAGEFYEKEEKYKHQLEAFAPDELIIRTDYIADDAIRYYFCASDYVVLPYHSATQSGISQVALYYNKPLVCTDVGGLSEFVENGKTGILCEPNLVSLSQALDHAIKTDPNQYEQNIPEFKKRFSWQTFIENAGL